MDKAGTNTHVFVHKAVAFNLGNIVPGEKSGKGNNDVFFIIIAWGGKV